MDTDRAGDYKQPVLESATSDRQQLVDRVAHLEAALAQVTAERDKLRRAYEQLKAQLELLRRRIFFAKAERVDARQLEIEFAETHAKLVKLATELGEAGELATDAPGSDGSDGRGRTARAKPKGRRKLGDLDLPEERVEILDPALEGVAERIGFEESYHAGYRRGGPVRIVKARAVYKKASADSETPEIVTAPNPKEIYERGMLAPSLIAHILTKKFRWGMPFHRLALELESQGLDLDDSTMGRYAEHVGATFGGIVEACAEHAMRTAFCLSTDATGVAIQPARIPDGKRQACAKGHFFVVLADKDYVFFEYQPKHTSDAVCAMFKGFQGYIQADAHCVYDALFRGEAVGDDEKPPDEVACWSHARRRLWEAAVTVQAPEAREGLLRVRALFKLEEGWASLAPSQRHERRQRISRPMLDDFFAWAEDVFQRVRGIRGPVASAFGYAIRQRDALRRFLDDGRLRLENNSAERELRAIATGRRSWLFMGSDDHAQAAANLFSLVASCRLHVLDVETYLAEIIRVMPYWPRDRYLELAPKYWRDTRARLDERQLAWPIGPITVPPATTTK
ncbi:MAG TPA: IS66 family transposase [Polyangiaceae bacterium]|nr:IS66 family transposase [Polyangiaceae bacterium]